jgi:hypothetical protein
VAPSYYPTLTRFTRGDPCPACGGYPSIPRGRGERCAGFGLGDAAYCTRSELSGSLPIEISTQPPTYRHRLSGPCACGIEHSSPFNRGGPLPRVARARHEGLSLETRHAIISAALELLDLRKEAAADLYRRGLIDDDLQVGGYRSLPATANKKRFLGVLIDRFGETLLQQCPGFTNDNGQTDFWTARQIGGASDGYLIPYRDENGFITGIQVRWADGKYKTFRNSRTAVIYHLAGRADQSKELYITEGGLKAQVSHRHGGVTVLGLPGQGLSPDHIAAIQRLRPGCIVEALDQEDNKHTEAARTRWLKALAETGLPLYRAVWEGSDLGGPKGLDDLFASGGQPRLRAYYAVPPATGQRRRVYETGKAGLVEVGMPLREARRTTQDAIEDFIAVAARQR